MSNDDALDEFTAWCQALGFPFDLVTQHEMVSATTFGSSKATYLPGARTWTLKIAGDEISGYDLVWVLAEGQRVVLQELRKFSA